MHIDLNYCRGGSFRIGRGPEQPFPLEKPAKPFLYQGNADTLTLKNFEGKALTFQVPQYSYFQVQDNREWGWSIFEWWFAAPCNAGQKTYKVKITPGAGDVGRSEAAGGQVRPVARGRLSRQGQEPGRAESRRRGGEGIFDDPGGRLAAGAGPLRRPARQAGRSSA